MEDNLSSPERPVKVTYATRHKKRRETVVTNDDAEDSHGEVAKDDEPGQEEEGDDQTRDSPGKEVRGETQDSPDKEESEEAGDSPDKEESGEAGDSPDKEENGETKDSPDKEATGTKREPKKIDVVLPGPSPRRERQGSPASSKKPVSRAKRASHSRASSLLSVSLDAPNDLPQTPPAGKPASAASLKKPESTTGHTHTSESPVDDRSSVGESSKAGGRTRKTEAERMQFLQEDSLSGEVEPYRVYCNGCQSWISLHSKRRYVMQPWINHRKTCIKQHGQSERSDVSVKSEADPGEEDNIPVSVAPPDIAPPEKASRERPSSRIAMAQRKLQLVNDPQVKKLTEHSVECANCRTEVTLKGNVDYDLTRWEEHKTLCTKSTPRPLPSHNLAAHLTVAAIPLDRPPPSIASTDEATVIGSESSPPRAGEKRSREEDDDEEEQSRPANRPRTLFYERPEGDSPGFLDWLALPFRSFVRGFREGLSSG